MILERYCYSEECTRGRLKFGEHVLHTLERPWRPGAPGGLPWVSCVPDGRYQIISHVRPNGDHVLALRNPDLGVYHSTASVPADGGPFRTLILLHAANYVDQVQGCIAPGVATIIHENRRMVTQSRQAMRLIMDWYEDNEPDEIEIRSALGTGEP